MTPDSRYQHPDEFELVSRNSTESRDSFDLDDEDPETQGLTSKAYVERKPSFWSRLVGVWRQNKTSGVRRSRAKAQHAISRRHFFRRLCFFSHAVFLIVLGVAILTAVFRPSYAHPPRRYNALRRLATERKIPGRANPTNDKIFIAASIFDIDGELAQGTWGEAVLSLVDLLGPDNVFLSIYENDAGSKAKEALEALEQEVDCDHKIVFEEHLDPKKLPHVTLPDKTKRVKRIEYLAEVRNRALKPLEGSDVKWDRILYLNDVIFDPVEAVQLLLLTNADDAKGGHANYRTACAVDFINPFKFYDTFATRDLEGFSMGLPFFPWFTDAGEGQSRRDVLDQKEAIMVKSCWGGMVAFDAKYFQFEFADKLNTAADAKSAPPAGFRFRAEQDLFWDASECCLIHADIQNPDPTDTGIYMNPYIRVAYDTRTFSWLHFTRRFERLYAHIHWILNHLVGLPWHNPRRAEKAGTEVEERVWVPNDGSPAGGSFKSVKRRASHAGFCGRRALQVMLEKPVPGQRSYEVLPVPASR